MTGQSIEGAVEVLNARGARAFGSKRIGDSHRARLRGEMARLRRALAALVYIEATPGGFVLAPRKTKGVLVLAPPFERENGAIRAFAGTGVTFCDGSLWHGAAGDEPSELRRIDRGTGAVLERIELPEGVIVSGLEYDGGDRFNCGRASSGKVLAVERPRARRLLDSQDGSAAPSPSCSARPLAKQLAACNSSPSSVRRTRPFTFGSSRVPQNGSVRW